MIQLPQRSAHLPHETLFGTQMAVACVPGDNLAKPELPSLRSLRSLCLRILSSRPPVEAASSTKAHEDRSSNRSSPREQKNWYLIQTSGPTGPSLAYRVTTRQNRNSPL